MYLLLLWLHLQYFMLVSQLGIYLIYFSGFGKIKSISVWRNEYNVNYEARGSFLASIPTISQVVFPIGN